MEETYNRLTEYYSVSARKYFEVLRLALLHTQGVHADSSYYTVKEIAKIDDTEKRKELYECAIRILKTLYKEN